MPNLFDIELIFTQIPIILQALPETLILTAVAMIFGVVIGLVLSVIKIKKVPVLSQAISVYVSFTRGTPLLIQLYLSFYGIPLALKYLNFYHGTDFNINGIPNIIFAMVALSFNEAAYNSETFRGAYLSVDKGQIEAANSLGMSGFQIIRRVIFPQAGLVALPSLGNSLISLLKGTSLAFIVSVVELTARGNILAGSNYRFFEVNLSLAIIYWVLSIAIEQGVKLIEKRLAIPDEVSDIKPTEVRGEAA